jgi:Cu+-exporting ATPase
MTVVVEGARQKTEHRGRTVYFCGAGCRARFEADPVRYALVS